jgi:membrane associated rhomboid family serine protease
MIPFRTVGKKNNFRAYGTFTIVMLSALVFFWEIIITTQAGQPIEQLLPLYAFQTCEVGTQPITHIMMDGLRSLFMHTTFVAFATNMLFLWIFAPRVESFLGHRVFLGLYILGGFGGYIVTTLFAPHDCAIVVGSNAGVSTVLGAFFFLHPMKMVDAFVPILNRTLTLPAILFMLAYLALTVFSSQGGPLSGDLLPYWDEVGGFVSGFAMMFIITTFYIPVPPVDPFEYLDD